LVKGRIVLPNVSRFKSFRAAVARQDPDGGARVVVQVTGEVDVATSALLADAIARAMELEARERIDLVIDLSDMRFIDASGMSVLVKAAQQARARGGTLVLRSPSPAVRRLLDVLRLGGVLPVSDPDQEACRHRGQRRARKPAVTADDDQPGAGAAGTATG
jgi:anti-anti-sigma factor